MSERKLSSYEMEKLIALVRENPGLYDKTLHYYKDQIWTSNCWQIITNKLDIEGLTAEVLRKKWKNKRDSYKKNKKVIEMRESGSDATKISFYRELSFLDPHLITISNTPQLQIASVKTEEVNDQDVSNSMEYPSTSQAFRDEESEELDSKLSVMTSVRTMQLTPAGKRRAASASSYTPSPCPDSGRKRKRRPKRLEQIDDVIMGLVDQSQSTDIEIKNIPQNVQGRDEDDDFYIMISRKVRKLSSHTQSWMEEKVWDIYQHARRLDKLLPPFP